MNVSNSNATRSKHGPRGEPPSFSNVVRKQALSVPAFVPDTRHFRTRFAARKPVSRTILKVKLNGVTQNAMDGRVRSGKRPLPDKLCVDTLSSARRTRPFSGQDLLR